MQYMTNELREHLGADQLFETVTNLDSEVFREMEDRKTCRVTVLNDHYFVKAHFGVGWKEIIKNLISLKLPILSARNEWEAIEKLKSIGIDTMSCVGYGSYGINPAHIKSFVMTKELSNTESLEDYFLKRKVSFRQRVSLLNKVTEIAACMHANGINHQDFYICHFLLDLECENESDPRLYVIDLHRAQIRTRMPGRWRVKDVSAIFFSCFDIGISRKDLFRFMMKYSGKTLRATLIEDRIFWNRVLGRAKKLYLKINDRLPDWVVELDG